MHYSACGYNQSQKNTDRLYSGRSKAKAELAIDDAREKYDNLFLIVDYGFDKGLHLSVIKGEFVPEFERV